MRLLPTLGSALVTLVVLAACSTETVVRSGPAAGDPGAGDPSEGGADGGPEGSVGPGPFALDLTVNEKTKEGSPVSTLMFVAVRDADTKELIAISRDEEKLVGSVRITKPGVILPGHRYEIGVKDTWYGECHASSANVWFREIPPATGDVTLAFDVQEEVGTDVRGCNVLHEPVKLPPGTYATTQPVLGIAGNRVSLVVSKTGHVYTRELQVFCGVTSQCVSTTVTAGACDLEQVVYPGESSFELGSSAASHTTITGKATIDATAKTIRYTGRTYTWTGSSTICCDQKFDVTLTKVDSAATQCF